MPGSVYTFVGASNPQNQTASIQTSQGTVALGQSGLFLPAEVAGCLAQGLTLVQGPASSPASYLSAPTLAAGSVGSPNGVYRCCVTFVTTVGETIAGPEATITVSSQQINWTVIPTAPATAGVIARKLYRTDAGGASGTEELVTTLADNITTTYTDNLTDVALGASVPTIDTSVVTATDLVGLSDFDLSVGGRNAAVALIGREIGLSSGVNVAHVGSDGLLGTPGLGGSQLTAGLLMSSTSAISIDPTLPPYNAKFDAAENGGASATATQFTIACPAFATAWQAVSPIGKSVLLIGAGTPSGSLGGLFYSTVTAYDGANTITVANAIGTTVAGATLCIGTDDTTALNAAFAAAAAGSRGATIQLPAARAAFYNGAGLSATYNRIVSSAGEIACTIYLGAGCSLVQSPAGPSLSQGTYIRNVRTVGGFGMIRYTFTGVNSGTYKHTIDHVRVESFTGAGISTLATDDPFWKVKAWMHLSPLLAPSNQIGFAHLGLFDACDVDIDFFRMPIGFKLGSGGPNGRIRGSFTEVTPYVATPRIAIWVVPSTIATGNGLVIDQFRFGNEGLATQDYRILYADEDTATGADFAQRSPKWTASTGFITGHIVTSACTFYGTGSAPAGPLIYSTTPNVRGCHWMGSIAATRPGYIIQFLNPPGPDYTLATNTIGPFVQADTTGNGQACRPSNAPGFGVVLDPTGLHSAFPETVMSRPGGSNRVGTAILEQASVTLYAVTGAASIAPIADGLGGTDAVEMTTTTNSGADKMYAQWASGGVVVGTPMWVEFDLKAGSSSSLTDLQVQITYSTGTIHDQRRFNVPPNWTHFRYYLNVVEAAANFQIRFQPNIDAAGGKVQIGRVRVYQAREPLALDAANTPNVQVFAAGGTWTKPQGVTTVHAAVVGGGGGGGSGRRGAAGTVRCGGGPGGPGGWSAVQIPAVACGATEVVQVAGPGVIGAAVTVDDTNGNPGGAGGSSYFGTAGSGHVYAQGGNGGGGGTNATGLAGAGGAAGMVSGAAGTAASTTGLAGGNSPATIGAAAGGPGGGISAANAASAGGNGAGTYFDAASGGGAGGAIGANGSNGYSHNANEPSGGGGGGGGGSSITGAGGAGGAGGLYGAGGGGGGASLDGNNSGAGGAAAGGIVVVTSW